VWKLQEQNVNMYDIQQLQTGNKVTRDGKSRIFSVSHFEVSAFITAQRGCKSRFCRLFM